MKTGKFIAVVAAAALVLGCVPQAMAEEIGEAVGKNIVAVEEEYSPLAESADYTYEELVNGTLSITKYNGTGGDVVIPGQIDGKTVTKIGNYAFNVCPSLTSVVIPDSVTEIGYSAFSYCSSLTSVVIPNSVFYIGGIAFGGCSSLTEINIGSENTNYSSIDGVLYNKNCTELLAYPGGKKGSFTIPDSVRVIGYGAFWSCSSLTSVEIPDSVIEIGNSVFEYCSSLTSVVIPDSVFFIGNVVFGGCSSLTEINIGSENTNYSSIDGVLYNKNCTELLAYPGGKKGGFTIPDSVTVIGYGAFEYCSSLKSVVIPNSVTKIGDYAFEFCSSLTSVVIPNSVTEIGEYAFEFCSSLTSVVIPNSVTTIDYFAFGYCSALTSVVIPDSVTAIYRYAFDGCSSLTSVEIPDSVIIIGSEVFRGCSSLTEINIGSKNTNYSSIDGVLYNKNCTELLVYPGGKKGGFTIPDGVTVIGEYAFERCSFLTSVVIPESVTKIGLGAFWSCSSLTTIYGYKDTLAEEYANRNEIKFVVIESKTIYNAETEISVEGVVISGTTLLIEKNEANDDEIKYDISLIDSSGNPVQLIESVTVKIPLPSGWDESKCKVYRSEKDGTFTDMEAEYINGYMVFTTDHFSEYVVTTKVPAPKGMLGDINNDKKVTIADARMLLQAASGSRELTEEQEAVADVNGDGKITIADARWLLQVASGSRVLGN